MKYFDSLIGAHEGRPAVIICGGPSTPKQFKKVIDKLDDPVLISVNQHGCRLTECDYAVSLDNIYGKMKEHEGKTKFLCPYSWADIKLVGYWNATNSGRTACWLAWRMGCTPIVLVGADCYQNRETYYWDRNEHSSGLNVKVDGHLKEWRVVLSKVPEEILTSAGGPLVEHGVMQKFDGRRNYPRVPFRPEKIDRNSKAPDGTKVEIIRGCWAEGIQYWVGEAPILRERTARQLVRAGKAQYAH